ncbi:hypothetical protein ANANG_G00054010 [Anguilla anguilla]|uniref:Coenzyme Q-binding protein COQ10 homolog B, mitochondrial n=1 Tax=Anguilla anguilla TaxID=7936 RepID=A0A9D3MS08_ANGAN|nr:hypothetical protein ANANG_G00054010 [Anguilla anguilla]
MARGARSLRIAVAECINQLPTTVCRGAPRRNGVRYLSSCGILMTRGSPYSGRAPAAPHRPPAARSFFNLAESFNKRKEYSGAASSGLLPICAVVQTLRSGLPPDGFCKAKLEVGFPPVMERYTSLVSTVRPHMVKAACSDGKLFNHLETVWRFSPGLPGYPRTCTLDFARPSSGHAKVTFRAPAGAVFFDEVVKQMVSAFGGGPARSTGPRPASRRSSCSTRSTKRSAARAARPGEQGTGRGGRGGTEASRD